MTFEEGMAALEAIVRDLETGASPLSESFKLYEKGMKLYGQLKKMLDEGDAKIEKLAKIGSTPMEEDRE